MNLLVIHRENSLQQEQRNVFSAFHHQKHKMAIVLSALIACICNVLLALLYLAHTAHAVSKIICAIRRKTKSDEQQLLTKTGKQLLDFTLFGYFRKAISFCVFFVWRSVLCLEYALGVVGVPTSDIPSFLFTILVMLSVYELLERIQESKKGDSAWNDRLEKLKTSYLFASVFIAVLVACALLGAIIILNIQLFTSLVFYYILFTSQLVGVIGLTMVAAFVSKSRIIFIASFILTARCVVYVVQTFLYGCDVNFICELMHGTKLMTLLDWSSVGYYVIGEGVVSLLLFWPSIGAKLPDDKNVTS